MASPGSMDRSDLTAELDAAVAGLGALGDHFVPTGAILRLDAWLGRPQWLFEGVTTPLGEGDLPAKLPLRDDLRITGNLLINLGFNGLVTLFDRATQWPMGRLTSLLSGFAPSLGAAVDAVLELGVASNPHLEITSRVEGQFRTLELRARSDLGPAGIVVALTFALQTHRMLEARPVWTEGPVQIGFAWDGPEDLSQVPVVAGATFHFGRTANTITYPCAWDAQRNPMHDPLIWAMALRMAEEQTAARREPEVVAQVRVIVAQAFQIDQRPPSLREVASRLGKSVRSLERNLTQAGATYRVIVEAERKRLAAALLSDKGRSIQEISDLLGFSDRTSFTRSFRTWFNVPPAAFRQQLQGLAV